MEFEENEQKLLSFEIRLRFVYNESCIRFLVIKLFMLSNCLKIEIDQIEKE